MRRTPSPCERDQEVVVVLLDEGEVRLSEALAQQYHALKLPGMDALREELAPSHRLLRAGIPREGGGGRLEGRPAARPIYNPSEEQRSAIERIAAKTRAHVSGVLEGALAAHAEKVASAHSPKPGSLGELRALEKLEAEAGVRLGSQPWQFLERLSGSQAFQQWEQWRAGAPLQPPN